MKTILVTNQKGGVGKTMLVDEICSMLEADEIKYNLYDMDQQGSLFHHPVKYEDAQVTIVDTPGALQKELKSWIEESDMIIVPTLMGGSEMAPFERMIEILEPYQGKKEILFILNRWNRFSMTRDFTKWFETKYPDLKSMVVAESIPLQQARAHCESIQNFNSRNQAAKQLLGIYGYIKTQLGLKEGWR